VRPLSVLKNGLGALVVLCVGLRLMAWLVAPALPLVAVLFVLVGILGWVLFPNRRL